MVTDVASPEGVLVFATGANRATLSRQAKVGRALRLAPGVYAVGASLPPDVVARRHRLALIAHYWPAAVLCGRTALAGGEPVDGVMYLAHPAPPRTTELMLPGLVLRVQAGPGRLPGDMPMPHGLWLSGPARGLVENVHLPGRPRRSRAGTTAVEDAVDELARTGGAGRIRTTLSQLDVIASSFDPHAVKTVRARLAAVLGTVDAGKSSISARLQARISGQPYDQHRVELFEGVVQALLDRAPEPRHFEPDAARWQWLPFFEAYFSNYIEGTRFGVDEARAIAIDGVVPQARPADAHDVAATFRLASDPVDARRIARTSDAFIDLLENRHRVLLAARPDQRPGALKEEPNYAGGYRFVDPELVVGTLARGFDVLNPLVDAFARAVAMMVLVTEVHPFDDGNGRVARLMANAELAAAGQLRIVVPTVYRNNYLAGLSGVSNRAGRGESLIAVLDFAQRWTQAVDWTSYDGAREAIESSNGFLDASRADADGLRLRLP